MYYMYECKIILLASQGTGIIQEMTFFPKVNVHGIPAEKAEEHRKVCVFPVRPTFLK